MCSRHSIDPPKNSYHPPYPRQTRFEADIGLETGRVFLENPTWAGSSRIVSRVKIPRNRLLSPVNPNKHRKSRFPAENRPKPSHQGSSRFPLQKWNTILMGRALCG